MTETFLHHLYHSRKLGKSFQTTTDNQIDVLEFGKYNHSSGPDFLEAKIKYDGKIWAGHIEFHLKSSDWNKHGHQYDEAYGNVIAHFVLHHDQEIKINQFQLPVVELSNKIDEDQYTLYRKLIANKNWISCEKMLSSVPNSVVQRQLTKVFEQRLNRKTDEVWELLKAHQFQQHKTLLQLVAKVMGGQHNAVAMQELMRKVSFDSLQLFKNDTEQITDYLLCLAGLGKTAQEMDQSQKDLINFLQLTPMSKVNWKTFGMRPPSQPKNRIRQLGAILSEFHTFLSQPEEFVSRFEQFVNSNNSILSDSLGQQLKINALIPLRLCLIKTKSKEKYQSELHLIMQAVPAEKNKIIERWGRLGIQATSAKESQALIELKNEHCSQKKCLFCAIGKSVLKQ